MNILLVKKMLSKKNNFESRHGNNDTLQVKLVMQFSANFTVSFTSLVQCDEMIIFELVLSTFEASSIF